MHTQPTLFDLAEPPARRPDSLTNELRAFVYQDKPTDVSATTLAGGDGNPLAVPTFTNEFWTSRQPATGRFRLSPDLGPVAVSDTRLLSSWWWPRFGVYRGKWVIILK